MLLVVGRVGRPHGIRGEVAVDVRTDDPDQRFASGCVLATQPEALGPLTVTNARPHAGGLIVSFSGVTDRDAAEQLRGAWLVIDSADVPVPDDPDEFHDHQLIGLDVVTATGSRVGTVADVLHHGQDLLVIRPGDGDPAGGVAAAAGSPPAVATVGGPGAVEILVPFVAAIVPEVDLPAGRLVIDPPPGLLDQDQPA
ncbi:MAG TPA: ribosome maturation factor RimM [Streptosporangiaceae bacterium]|nr:ribosome maturation factor RimM [Streptosporangiaceae bacterium]